MALYPSGRRENLEVADRGLFSVTRDKIRHKRTLVLLVWLGHSSAAMMCNSLICLLVATLALRLLHAKQLSSKRPPEDIHRLMTVIQFG
jgi:hypothetical protein